MMENNEKPIPLKYFLPAISPYSPITATCPSCAVNATYSSHMRLNTSKGSVYLWSYQCQSCGTLTTSDATHPKGACVGLEDKCECGGQYRRDKNIFCPSCNYRKKKDNKSEDKLYATPEEMQAIRKRHGTEELNAE